MPGFLKIPGLTRNPLGMDPDMIITSVTLLLSGLQPTNVVDSSGRVCSSNRLTLCHWSTNFIYTHGIRWLMGKCHLVLSIFCLFVI